MAVVLPDARVLPKPSPTELLFSRMVEGRESFWSAVYEPFMLRDLTRDHVRELVRRGLEETDGDYKALAELFNIEASEIKRFLGLLRRYECMVTLQRLRGTMMKVEAIRPPHATLPVETPRRFGTDS